MSETVDYGVRPPRLCDNGGIVRLRSLAFIDNGSVFQEVVKFPV